MTTKTSALTALRAEVARMEGVGRNHEARRPALPFGLPAIDDVVQVTAWCWGGGCMTSPARVWLRSSARLPSCSARASPAGWTAPCAGLSSEVSADVVLKP